MSCGARSPYDHCGVFGDIIVENHRVTAEMTPNSYRERPAPAQLAGVVACFWSRDVYAAREQRVLPDGCLDLIWMDGAVHVAGPDTCAFLATLNNGQTLTGLRFRPGAAPGVLGIPAYPGQPQATRQDEIHMRGGVRVRRDVQTQQPVERQRGGHVGHHDSDHIQLRVNGHDLRPYGRIAGAVLNGSDATQLACRRDTRAQERDTPGRERDTRGVWGQKTSEDAVAVHLA
ncbi:MAG: hypothetical protein QOG46_785 [Pseudonocardiales bacterium]|jgi:hypothetical protein|nr:hypothetical protein [Pseudonocardiales bacterium]